MTQADDYNTKRYSYEQSLRVKERYIHEDRLLAKVNKAKSKVKVPSVFSNLYDLLKEK